jgi:hypothetical protein
MVLVMSMSWTSCPPERSRNKRKASAMEYVLRSRRIMTLQSSGLESMRPRKSLHVAENAHAGDSKGKWFFTLAGVQSIESGMALNVAIFKMFTPISLGTLSKGLGEGMAVVG